MHIMNWYDFSSKILRFSVNIWKNLYPILLQKKSIDTIFKAFLEKVVDPGILEMGGGGWDCFNAPLHIPYAMVVRLENTINIVNIACWFQ